MCCAAARICSPSPVTRRPSTWRVNSVTPSCASSSLMRRRNAFIDCPRLHAAERKLPHWATSTKVRTFSQSGISLPGAEAGCSFNGTPLCCRGYIQNLPVHLGFWARTAHFELFIRVFGPYADLPADRSRDRIEPGHPQGGPRYLRFRRDHQGGRHAHPPGEHLGLDPGGENLRTRFDRQVLFSRRWPP